MSSHPGDDARPEGQHHADGAEPTQPIGYWERKALQEQQEQQRAQAAGQGGAGGSWGQGGAWSSPASSGSSWGTPSPAVGQPAYAPSYPYPQQAPYGGWGPQPTQDHPRAVLALVLGVVAVAGGFACGLPVLAAPFAWAIGSRTLRDIRNSQGQLGGQGLARAGQVLGIVGTILILLVLAAIAFFVFTFASSTQSGFETNA